ncbi:MAG: hypothetical protein Q4D96_00660 [Propionibacteriaceae bacterium]|nr:hypothetical protein [Propionibacteriaceae bacterium]
MTKEIVPDEGVARTYFMDALMSAATLPGVRISREDFLRRTLSGHCTPDQVDAAIATTPAQAGIPASLVERLAKQVVRGEATRVSAFSAATGLPGGFALLGMVPLDMAQNLAHVLRVSQKLAYLHGWPSFFDGEELDETTTGILTLFTGVMFGAHGATQGIAKVSNLLAARVATELPKRALSQKFLYTLVKRIATQLGMHMSKDVFAKGVSKVVPVLGGLVSGGFTMATFWPMASRLRRHLAALELAQP